MVWRAIIVRICLTFSYRLPHRKAAWGLPDLLADCLPPGAPPTNSLCPPPSRSKSRAPAGTRTIASTRTHPLQRCQTASRYGSLNWRCSPLYIEGRGNLVKNAYNRKVQEDRVRLHGAVGGLAGGGDGRANLGRVPRDAGTCSAGNDPGLSATEERNAAREGQFSDRIRSTESAPTGVSDLLMSWKLA